ncbi:hypothetical protein J2Z31_001149 [Sinorhizobium kostiense]|uniref:DUF4038 domain-containing protein n=1 Tax=Sinorhizobium kostiense TaxID=76747 RepID=A0ABS4QX83_9HYPH|nr:glycoside hydrolase family 140 protein [Sinorhizobium kostiense]MBP2234659.1 hypothetical protein [Sinorhizobium kostiense]
MWIRANVAVFCSALLLTMSAAAQQAAHEGPSWDFSHGDLRVSDNKRFLVHADGKPFFYLSDTNWNFFHRARREDAERLLEKRRQQGFTVISGPVTGILDSIYYKNPFGVPNPYGDLPFTDKDVTRPAVTPGSDPSDPEQYDYWDHVDHLVGLAESKGIYVGLIPAWWDHYRAGLVNKSNARAYGRFLGERYGGRRNIIWVLGGDTSIDRQEMSVREVAASIKRQVRAALGGEPHHHIEADTFREMAAGIKEAEARTHLMTFHARGSTSSSNWFHDDPWLDFNMLQSGHGFRDIANYQQITADYHRLPPKPTMDAENRYEDHSVGYDPKNGWFNDYDNRQAAYWGLFAGGHGHTYGNRGVWQMYEPGRNPSGPLRYYWYDAMDLPGAWDMKHVRSLMLSRPMLSRIPDQSLVQDALSGADHIRATRGDDFAFIYAATGRTFSVNLGKISGSTVVAWWFDPRKGTATLIGEFPNAGTRTFDPPGEPQRENDWVLVIDDKEKGYSAPGMAPVKLSSGG